MLPESNYTYRGKYLIVYVIVESLRCTPQTNLTLYMNYMSMKNIAIPDTILSARHTKRLRHIFYAQGSHSLVRKAHHEAIIAK